MQENPTPSQAINIGFQLGLVLLGLFIVAGALTYLVAGLMGADGTPQLCMAAALGPVIGSLLFGVWWWRRQNKQ